MHEKIRQNGWQQGSCLLIDENHSLHTDGKLKYPGTYIVISQDCDLINPRLENEPHVELLYLTPLKQKKESIYLGGRNSRTIHFDLEHIEKGKIAYSSKLSHDKYSLNRKYLAELCPDPQHKITDRELKNLIRCLVRRYNRSAFPNEFNDRLKGPTKKIKKILDGYTKEIHNLYIELEQETELSSNETYKIKHLYMLIEIGTEDNVKKKLINEMEKIVELIEENNISIERYHVLNLKEISAYQYLSLKEWDFEYLSYSD